MDIFLPQLKFVKLIALWKQICKSKEISLMDLTQLLEKIKATGSGSTIRKTSDKAPSASLNQCFEIFRYISSKTVIRSGSPGGMFLVDMKSNSVQWRSLILPPPDLLMTTDTSIKGCGTSCQDVSIGGSWSKEEQKNHISVLELKTVKLGLLNFRKFRKI